MSDDERASDWLLPLFMLFRWFLQQTLGGQGVWMPTPMYPAAQMVRPQPTQLQQTLRPQALSSGQYVPSSQPGSIQQTEPQTAQSSLDSNGMAPQAGSVYQRVSQKMEPQTAWVSHVDNEALSQTGNLYQHVTQQMEPQAARVSQDGSTATMSEMPGTAVSQAAQLLRDGAQAMSQLGLAYESTSLGSIPRSVARKLELPSAETRNAPRPSLSESSLPQPRVPGDVRQSQSWPAIPPQGMPRGWMSAQHGEVAWAAVTSMSEQVPLPSPNIPSSAAVLLSAPKQMQSPQVSGVFHYPSFSIARNNRLQNNSVIVIFNVRIWVEVLVGRMCAEHLDKLQCNCKIILQF